MLSALAFKQVEKKKKRIHHFGLAGIHMGRLQHLIRSNDAKQERMGSATATATQLLLFCHCFSTLDIAPLSCRIAQRLSVSASQRLGMSGAEDTRLEQQPLLGSGDNASDLHKYINPGPGKLFHLLKFGVVF